MEKIRSFLSPLLMPLALFVLFPASSSADSAGRTMYVNVQKTTVKKSTWFFSGSAGKLSYGDAVQVVSEKSKWSEVVSGSLRGWVPTSSLTKKKIVLKGDANAVSASADELALAGKGFSADAENVFRSENSALRYDVVDKIEQNEPALEAVYAFIVDGGLSGGGE